MIASLTGRLTSKTPHGAILDVNGVGYQVSISLNTFYKLPEVGQTTQLLVHTAVRDNDISLFGFARLQEKQLFQKLITVNGIGPKLAINILSGVSAEDLTRALSQEDIAKLTAIPGIGRKTAERLILDLKGKLVGIMTEDPSKASPTEETRNIYDDALSALTNLGYSRPQAERTLAKLPSTVKTSIETTVKEALKSLSESR